MVIGPAGSGKTTMLEAATCAWRVAGHQVLGVAHTGQASLELRRNASIPTATIDRFMGQLRRGEQHLDRGTVVIVDQAAMVDTRRLAALITATAKARAKLVLIGDPAQLPAIGAGGLFAAIAHRTGHVELTVNRRQVGARPTSNSSTATKSPLTRPFVVGARVS